MDEIIYLGSTTFETKAGKTLYKVSFAAHVDDITGKSYGGYEADTCLVSEDMYKALSKCKAMDKVKGIVIRDNYRLKIYRLL